MRRRPRTWLEPPTDGLKGLDYPCRRAWGRWKPLPMGLEGVETSTGETEGPGEPYTPTGGLDGGGEVSYGLRHRWKSFMASGAFEQRKQRFRCRWKRSLWPATRLEGGNDGDGGVGRLRVVGRRLWTEKMGVLMAEKLDPAADGAGQGTGHDRTAPRDRYGDRGLAPMRRD